MKSKIISYVFWVLCVTDIFAITFSYPILQWIAKPSLLPCLIYWYISETNGAKGTSGKLMLAGLFFCWMGDVLLMFESRLPIFFILGLASFLMGHIFYIFYFNKIPNKTEKTQRGNLLMLLPVAIYVAVLLNLLYPSLGPLKIPVIVYALVLGSMLSIALLQYQKIAFNIAFLFVAGAISFVISDSLLALNKFHKPFSQSGFFIMLTYCLAQYLIVMGGIKLYKSSQVVNGSK
jgi:uncharacterized membrane protein YhhN